MSPAQPTAGTAPIRHVAGCMTGTSLDGLDVAVVRVQGRGLAITAQLLGTLHRPLGDLADTLRSFATGRPHPPIDFMLASRSLGQLHADTIADACAEFLPAGAKLELAVAHGQTIWHAPEDAVSWQLFDPQPVVKALNVDVCFNLRQADLVAGGQGAPITPLADWVMYRHPQRHRLVVNLGGIANITSLPVDQPIERITGGDIGPCNILIDGLVQRFYPGKPFDQDGAIAASGTPTDAVLKHLHRHKALFGEGHHSLGREDFPEEWLDTLAADLARSMPPADAIASAVEAVATMVAAVAAPTAEEMVLAGGGSRNRVLVERVKALAPFDRVYLTDELGIPAEAREAMGFAVLGALSQDGVPISLPAITGSERPGRAGMWAFA